MEGVGKAKDAAPGESAIAHNALAVVSYDPKAMTYRIKHYTLDGRSGESEVKLIEGGLEWGFKDEARGSTIRFTAKIDGQKWHEVGEASPDGQKWFKFMEMTLERQK